jgi:large subunit ribosomal protein L21
MFAILKTGGKQYTVSAGDIIRVEKVEGDEGKVIELSQLMMINDGKATKVGTPLLSNSSIKATILEQTHNKTVLVYKKRRRQGYDRKNGHRQLMSVLHIDEIIADGQSIAKVQAPGSKLKEKAEPKVKEAPKVKAEAKPKVEKPVTPKVEPEKPVRAKSVAQKPVKTKPATKKPVAKKAAKKPAAKKTKE